ncbi:PadR family transcriptional regulator [bacterium]|nr:PadR family transcriptional regulator [bacterium]
MHHFHHHDPCGHSRFRQYHGHHGHFGKMPPWFGREMFGGHRAERGDVRYMILDAVKDTPAHGYQVIQTIKEKSGGRYQPSPGAIYPTLQMLTEEGLLEAKPEGSKTVYSITDAGREALEENADEVEDAYDRLGFDANWSDLDFSRIKPLVKRLGRAVKYAARNRVLNQEAVNKVTDILEEAVDSIEKLLKRR